MVRSWLVRSFVVRGSLVRGSFVAGSLVRGSFLAGSLVRGSFVTGLLVRGFISKPHVAHGISPTVYIYRGQQSYIPWVTVPHGICSPRYIKIEIVTHGIYPRYITCNPRYITHGI